MSKAPMHSIAVGVHRLQHVFNRKPRAADAAEELLPAVEILERPALAQPARLRRRERALAVVTFGEGVVAGRSFGPQRRLQACRRLVLAYIESAGPRHACNRGEHWRHVGDVAGAYRMDDEIELAYCEHRQFFHRRLYESRIKAALAGDGSVEGEHLVADVDDGDLRSGRGVEGAVPTAAGGETEDAPTADIAAEPTCGINGCQRVGELVVARRLSQSDALASQRIPRPRIVGDAGRWARRMVLRI